MLKTKKDIWREQVAYFSKITDGLGTPIDLLILDLVVGLNVFGIKTFVSCEGHIYEDRVRCPWIGFESTQINAALYEEKAAKIYKRIAENKKLSSEEKNKRRKKAKQLYNQARRPNLEMCQKLLILLD